MSPDTTSTCLNLVLLSLMGWMLQLVGVLIAPKSRLTPQLCSTTRGLKLHWDHRFNFTAEVTLLFTLLCQSCVTKHNRARKSDFCYKVNYPFVYKVSFILTSYNSKTLQAHQCQSDDKFTSFFCTMTTFTPDNSGTLN